MKYTIEVNDYTTHMVLALIAEMFKDGKELDEASDENEFFVTRYSPQVINWVLFQFRTHIDLLINSDSFNAHDDLWPIVMKSADALADAIRAQLEDEPDAS
jgi:hypothetical protein